MNLVEDDVLEYRWEAPISFGRYRSVTPPCHGIGAYRQETFSPPIRTFLSAPIELGSHHNLATYELRASPLIGASATVERIRSLISVHGQQARPMRKTCQSAKMGKHPHLGISLYEGESHPSRVSASAAADLPPTLGMSEYELQASPSMRVYPPATVENLLHCRVSACGPEAPPHVVEHPLTIKSPAITSQVCMISTVEFLCLLML
jgi:poly(rC)-binding protein 2/3/4